MANKPLTVSLGQFCLLVSDQKDPLQHSQEPAHLQVAYRYLAPRKFSARRTSFSTKFSTSSVH